MIEETPTHCSGLVKSVICAHFSFTADGVKEASVLKIAPLLRSHLTSAMKPEPSSNTLPLASGGESGCVTASTKGATNSGYYNTGEIV
jgi:hypothetical protein